MSNPIAKKVVSVALKKRAAPSSSGQPSKRKKPQPQQKRANAPQKPKPIPASIRDLVGAVAKEKYPSLVEEENQAEKPGEDDPEEDEGEEGDIFEDFFGADDIDFAPVGERGDSWQFDVNHTPVDYPEGAPSTQPRQAAPQEEAESEEFIQGLLSFAIPQKPIQESQRAEVDFLLREYLQKHGGVLAPAYNRPVSTDTSTSSWFKEQDNKDRYELIPVKGDPNVRWLHDTDNKELLGYIDMRDPTTPDRYNGAPNWKYRSPWGEKEPGAVMINWCTEVLHKSRFAPYAMRTMGPAPKNQHQRKRLDIFFLQKTYGVDPDKSRPDKERIVIYMSGVTMDKRTVTLGVRGFLPYIYFMIPRGEYSEHRDNVSPKTKENIEETVKRLNQELRRRMGKGDRKNTGMLKRLDGISCDPIVSCSVKRAVKDLYHYQGEGVYVDMVKVEFSHPAWITIARDLLWNPMGRDAGHNYTTGRYEGELPNWYQKGDSDEKKMPHPGHARHGGVGFNVYEGNVDYANRFIVDVGIKPSSWINVLAGRYQPVTRRDNRVSSCDEEYMCMWQDVHQSTDDCLIEDPASPGKLVAITLIIPKLLVMAFDMEMEPDDGAFPGVVNCPIVTIVAHCYFMGEEERNRFLFQLGDVLRPTGKESEEMANSTVFCYDSEREMLMHFFEFIQVMQPQFLMGWNSNAFDLVYTSNRCKVLGISHCRNLGTMPMRCAKWTTRHTKGKSMVSFDAPGNIVIFDLMYYISSMNPGFKSSLESVCASMLDINKLNFPYSLIERYMRTAKGRYGLMAYANRDVEVLYFIETKAKAILVLIEQSRGSSTPIQDLLNRGMQHQVYMLFLSFAKTLCPELFRNHEGHFPSFPRKAKDPNRKKYTGATVLEPLRDYYRWAIIVTVDFEGLYPSIICALNLCFTTNIDPRRIYPADEVYTDIRVHNTPISNTIGAWDKEGTDPILNGFVQNEDYFQQASFDDQDDLDVTEVRNRSHPCFATPKRQVGLVPKIQATLKMTRNKVKGEMKITFGHLKSAQAQMESLAPEGANPDEDRRRRELSKTIKDLKFRYDWLDARQLAIKVLMNSIYGFMGATDSLLPLSQIAEQITRFGRWLIAMNRCYINRTLNRRVAGFPYDGWSVYGDTDSVFVRCSFPKRWVYCPRAQQWIYSEIPLQEQASIVLQFGFAVQNYLNEFNDSICPVKDIIRFAFEKIYWMLVLVGKKTYSGLLQDLTGVKRIDAKGFTTKRADCVTKIRTLQKDGIMKPLVLYGDAEMAERNLKEALLEVAHYKTPIYELCESKSLSKDPREYKTKLAHTEVALSTEARTGRKAIPGDRITYVITEPMKFYIVGRKTTDARGRDMAEDAFYAITHGMLYNASKYVEKVYNNGVNLLQYCVSGGLSGLKERLLDSPDMKLQIAPSVKKRWIIEKLESRLEIANDEEERKYCSDALEESKRGTMRQYFQPTVVVKCMICGAPGKGETKDSEVYFCGECMMSPREKREADGDEDMPLASVVHIRCPVCKVRHGPDGPVHSSGLCYTCDNSSPMDKYVQAQVKEYEKVSDANDHYYDTCVKCTHNSGVNEVDEVVRAIRECGSKDCPIFFKRDIEREKRAKLRIRLERLHRHVVLEYEQIAERAIVAV